MRWGRTLFLFALGAAALPADELHLRDGTVIVGAYAGGSQKEVYFQRTLVGTEIYPLIMVESVKFSSMASVPPGASLQNSKPAPVENPVAPAGSLVARLTAPAATLKAPAATLKWLLALFLPPSPAAHLASTSH